MDPSDPDDEYSRQMRRERRRILTVGGLIVAVMLAFASLVFLAPWSPPHVVHAFGSDFTATGESCPVVLCFAPPAAAPVSLAAAKALAGAEPTIVRLAGPPLGWLGYAGADREPAYPPVMVFLQVGDDAFIPYRIRFGCCGAQG